MKNLFRNGITGLVILLATVAFSCGEDDEGDKDACYTCTACTGQYAHLINDIEYCVSGFDNRSDWEASKTALEDESGCTCE